MADEPELEKLREDLAKKIEEVRLLQRVSGEINASLDLTSTLEVALRKMDELFGFQHALILLCDGEHLEVVAERGYEGRGLGVRVPMGVGVVGVVAKRRKMMRVTGLRQQRAYTAAVRKRVGASDEVAELPGLLDAESQLAVPMMVKEELIGVLVVESLERAVYAERDELLVTIVANQAAVAIHNAQLFTDLASLKDTLEERVVQRTAELERSNRDLRETQAQLVQSGKMASLGMLAAGVSHELNTPLASIRSSAQLGARALGKVRDQLDPDTAPPKIGHALRAMESGFQTTLEAVERISDVGAELRNFSRLDEAERKHVALEVGVESTLSLFRSQLPGGIEIVTDYGELPPVLCYANQLNQLLINLLVNASEAIDGDGTITISVRRVDDLAELRIADTGRGIAADALPKIFDPGFTTKGVGVGTGLGLSICYRIVQRHEGTIDVESERGEGTRVIVRLPFEVGARS